MDPPCCRALGAGGRCVCQSAHRLRVALLLPLDGQLCQVGPVQAEGEMPKPVAQWLRPRVG